MAPERYHAAGAGPSTDPAVITRILAQRACARDSPHWSRSAPPRRRRSPTQTAAAPPHLQSRAPGSGTVRVPGCPGEGGPLPCDGLTAIRAHPHGPERHRDPAPGTRTLKPREPTGRFGGGEENAYPSDSELDRTGRRSPKASV